MMYPGGFFLIGGGPAAWAPGNALMKRFVQEAGGGEASIAIITAGSDDPVGANEVYWPMFEAFGAKQLFAPIVSSRREAENLGRADAVANSSAVFIAGGSQQNLIDRMSGTAFEAAIREVHRKGGLLGGTSSGSSLLGNPMILDGGTQNKHLRENMIDVGPGYGLVGRDIAIDTHFSSRGRLPRNIALIGSHTPRFAIGIDEDTALFIHKSGLAEVLGRHAVYIIDSSQSETFPDKDGENGSTLSRTNLALHCFTAGDRFDLKL